MKKRDLLLTGLFLCSVSAFAQPGVTEPQRYADDARVIFEQKFEGNAKWSSTVLNPANKKHTQLFTWQSEPIDTITTITYYKRTERAENGLSNANIYDGSKNFQIAGVRDSVIYLYNGIVRTDASAKDDSIFSNDTHSIETHNNATQNGVGTNGGGLDRYGEDGGNKYFRYVSASSDGGNGTSGTKSAEYRRSLFIRLRPGTIENFSSYRVTVFVKGKLTKQSESEDIPTIGLELMRGYFHNEKNFQVRFGSGTSFDKTKDYDLYTADNKDTEIDEWQKIVLMSYYNNDSLGDASTYQQGYYWDDDWNWTTTVDKDGKVDPAGTDTAILRFIKQPDKFFVRLSFRRDSTEFYADNLSLTKSWIGGVEHYNDMIRVNFGYETNLGALAQAAMDKNKIAAVQLPGQYFDVWAQFLNKSNGQYVWQKVPIASAEYQGDGYMYMWSEPWEDGTMRSFNAAKEVLVTFRNPVDREDLMLTYTGERYPNGLDADWIADGKKVFDFHNEISSLNPTILISPVTHNKVRGLADVPPVCQIPPYEDGTFGLDPETRELTFKFSRNLYTENAGSSNTNYSFVVLKKGGVIQEYWNIKPYGDITDGTTTIVRPSNYTTPLSGDYEIYFDQVTHMDNAQLANADDYAEDVSLNYHFGDFETNPASPIVVKSDWRSEITVDGAWDRPTPPSLYASNTHDGFYQGTGKNFAPYTKTGLYKQVDDGVHGDCFFYLCSYAKGSLGHLYSAHTLSAGKYKIYFYAFGWGRNSLTSEVFVYPKPATMDEASLETNRNATANAKIGEVKPTSNISWSGNDTEKTWTGTGTGYGGDGNIKGSDVQFFELNFSIATAGDYVVEWNIDNNGSQTYYGISLCNFTIERTDINMSVKPVRSVVEALAAANAQITKADAAPNDYQGTEYQTLKAFMSANGSFITDKKATKVNLPSEYEAEAKAIKAASAAYQVRLDAVDAYKKAYADIVEKINQIDTATVGENVAYKNIPEFTELKTLKTSYATYNCSTKTLKEVNAATAILVEALKDVATHYEWFDYFKSYVAGMKAVYADSAFKAHNATAAFYTTFGNLITEAEALDSLTGASVLKAKMETLYNTRWTPELKELSTIRIKALKTLSDQLGVTYNATYTDKIANVAFDDDELADVMKANIKVKLYEKINAGQDIAGTDLTPFIKNYYLYATVKSVADRFSKKLGSNKNDADVKGDAVMGANIMKIGHQYNSNVLYVVPFEKEYTDLLPGWTVYHHIAGGNSMSSIDSCWSYARIAQDTLVFDGLLSVDWGSKIEMKQTVEGLPYGVYSLSADYANVTHDGGNTKPTLKATVNGEDFTVTGTALTGKGTEGVVKVDNIAVFDAENVALDAILESGNSGGYLDNFKLVLTGKYDDPWYQQFWPLLLTNAQNELNTLMTVVDAAEAKAENVEYYTLGGIKLDAPKAGEILIRKTTKGNGKIVVDKVIIK